MSVGWVGGWTTSYVHVEYANIYINDIDDGVASTILKFADDMLFSFKNKYHYTYPNTYIALYSRTPKLPVTHTHPQKQEIVVHPS